MQKIYNKLAKSNKRSASVKHKVDLSMAKELRMAVDDLGIETPESLSNTIQLLETFTDGYYDYEALDVHRQSIEYIMGDTLIIR